MITVNVQDAKNHLSRYLALMEQGERVILCRRNIPIAELKPLNGAGHTVQDTPASIREEVKNIPPEGLPETPTRRAIGLCRHRLNIPDSAFFDPLPKEILEAFYGGPPPPCIPDDNATPP